SKTQGIQQKIEKQNFFGNTCFLPADTKGNSFLKQKKLGRLQLLMPQTVKYDDLIENVFIFYCIFMYLFLPL
uniref:hypothetical protein n=1 Tax=Flavonifractor plautii TaxID=292800 RepID=UPI003D7CC21B